MTAKGRSSSKHGRIAQRGVAAIETALVLLLFITLVYGIATFGAVFYTQQVVSRAAEDGARALTALNSPFASGSVPGTTGAVQSVVWDSMASSLIVPAASNGSAAARRSWLAANVPVVVASNGLVTVSYPYAANRILNISAPWEPATIVGRARLSL